MSEKLRRYLFFNLNKYQERILLPAFVICLISCVITVYTIYYVHYIDKNIAVMCNFDIYRLEHQMPWFMHLHSFNKVVPWLFFGMTALLLVTICWMHYVSSKLLGPTTRVLRELDQILNGERKEPIGTRPGDEVFEELLKRINALIKRL